MRSDLLRGFTCVQCEIGPVASVASVSIKCLLSRLPVITWMTRKRMYIGLLPVRAVRENLTRVT
jgi:hypothetical protein